MRQIVLSVAALVIVVVILKLTPVAGQGPTTPAEAEATAQAGSALETPWGEPDLQGIWTDYYDTPLQRPARYTGKEFFTEAERAELDARRAKRLDRDYRDLERYPRGTVNDLQGSYNGVYHLRKRTGRRTSLIADPPDGRIPPLTPEAAKRQETMREFQLALLQASPACENEERSCRGGTYGPPSPRFAEAAPFYSTQNVNRSNGPEDRSLGERCLAGFNLEFSNANGFSRRIVQTPGGISIFYDSGQGQGWQRNIVMNGSPHLPSHVRQWWGDSRGHWEGDTLVVDVTNFSPKTNNFGSGENLHLVERFTRTGPETLEYVVTIEDPTTWTRPWTVKQEYTQQNGEQNRIYTEPRCHEGNYGLPGLLSGARADDQAFAEGRGPHPAELCIAGCGYVPEDDTSDSALDALLR